MLAVRKTAAGPGNVSVQEIPEPAAGPGQVVIEVAAAGICGTDVHIVHDEFPTEPPVTLGHELAGRIAEVGSGVEGWEPGDRVTSETYFFTCGSCRWCRNGRPNLCACRRSIGSRENGAFARFLAVPARNLHRVPDGLPLEAAALTEPLACVVHGVSDVAGVRAGDRVAITGPGPIGLLAAQLARAEGAQVLLIGAAGDEARLETARQLGVDGTFLLGNPEDLTEAAADVLGPDGADVVIECSGAGAAAGTLLGLVAKGGRWCQLGLYGRPVELDFDEVCYRELRVTGTNATVPSAWPRALRLLADGLVNAEALISSRFPVSAWNQALRAVTAREGLKVLLTPGADHAS